MVLVFGMTVIGCNSEDTFYPILSINGIPKVGEKLIATCNGSSFTGDYFWEYNLYIEHLGEIFSSIGEISSSNSNIAELSGTNNNELTIGFILVGNYIQVKRRINNENFIYSGWVGPIQAAD